MRFAAIFVAAALAYVACSKDAPVIQLIDGQVQGAWQTTLGVDMVAFRGLPYAMPPVGTEGRWNPPRVPKPWSGIYNATYDRDQCIQFMPPASNLTQSEDCLYLNVFTAKLPNYMPFNGPVPVFVWLYGGSLVDGSVEAYGAVENLVALAGGEVIVVAVSYRLNAFGFLALRELSQNDPRGVSGNYGILDQQAALQWVQSNIGAFGGDPRRVTLYGQSSGGTSIFALLSSPGSANMFSAAIALSGSPNMTMDLGQAEAQNAAGWLANTRCAGVSDVLQCLYALDAADIVQALPASWNPPTYFPMAPGGNHLPGLVIVDGVTVTEPLLDALSNGMIDVPLILTTMRDEYDLWPNATMLNMTSSDYKDWLTNHFSKWSPTTGAAVADLYSDVIAQYPGQAFYDLGADTGVTCGHIAVAASASKGFKSGVYLGVNMHSPSKPYQILGQPCTLPFHMWDYLAATRTWNFLGSEFQPSAEDIAYGDMVRANWLSLAFNGTALPEWKDVADAPAGSEWVTAMLSAKPLGMTPDYKRTTCAGLFKLGIGQPYWWIN